MTYYHKILEEYIVSAPQNFSSPVTIRSQVTIWLGFLHCTNWALSSLAAFKFILNQQAAI